MLLGVQFVASLFLFRHLVHVNPQVTCSNGWDVAVETFQEVFWPTTYFTIPHFLSVPYWRHHRRTELVFYTIPNDPLTIVDQRIRVSEQAISNGTHQQSEIYCPDIPIEPLCQPNSNLVRSTYLESPLREYFHNYWTKSMRASKEDMTQLGSCLLGFQGETGWYVESDQPSMCCVGLCLF